MTDEKIKTEIEFELTQKFDYAHKGNSEIASFIRLDAPTSKNMNECAFLKQAFFRALNGIGSESRDEHEIDDDKGEIDGAAVMAIITMSTTVELSSVLVTARELFASGVAFVDGEEKVTKPIIDKMSQDDLESMTGEYVANFIIASALRKMKKT